MDELGGKKEHREGWDGREREGGRGLAHQSPLHLQGLVNFRDLSRGTRDPCRLVEATFSRNGVFQYVFVELPSTNNA